MDLDIEGSYSQQLIDKDKIMNVDEILQDMIDNCRRDLKRYPDSDRAYTNLGYALLNANQRDEAIECFIASLKLKKPNVNAWNGLRKCFDS